jgi:hypothetical protein
MTTRLIILLLFATLLFEGATAQHEHPTSSEYEWPTDPLVSKKLDAWQDLKFGMIIHWGLYAEAGIIESWSLCSEEWISRDSTANYPTYKKWYWDLSKKFNPQKFDPQQWGLRKATPAGKEINQPGNIFLIKRNTTMTMAEKKDFSQFERDELLIVLNDLQDELVQKKLSLRETRNRLHIARRKIKTLKETVGFQRRRIVDLYKSQGNVAA